MIETYLNEVINERVKSHISLKNNWNITSEIGILVDVANENEALLPRYFYWLKNYFDAVGIPFEYLSHEILNENLSHFPIKDTLIKGLNSVYVCPTSSRSTLASQISKLHIQLFQTIEKHSKPKFESYILNDAEKHLDFLEQAIQSDSILLFTEYIAWANATLTALGISTDTLIRFLISIRSIIAQSNLQNGITYIDSAVKLLIDGNAISATSSISFTQTTESQTYLKLLLSKQKIQATQYILELIEQEMDIKKLFIDVFQASQYELGRLWELNQITVAQEHFCTAATQNNMAMLTAKVMSQTPNGKSVVATCVGTEQHEIGIRIVSDFLEMEGWNTYYMGANVPTHSILWAIEENDADLLALSVTLTPHIKTVKEIIHHVKDKFPEVKIMVGGYPFLRDPELWHKIGADGVAASALEVNDVALRIVK
jgi:methanogenic corrinoid protein MtbC1